MGALWEQESMLQKPLLKQAVESGIQATTTSPNVVQSPVYSFSLNLKKSPVFILLTAALRTASRLSNLFPTGVFLLFQILCPLLTNGGDCQDSQLNVVLPIVLVSVCSLLCLLSSFTDAFQTADGETHHGFITIWGLWTPHLVEDWVNGDSYMLNATDIIHAVLSLIAFLALALFDKNMRSCLYPDIFPELLAALMPLIIGFILSLAFMFFPTKRRGVGFLLMGETYLEVRVDGIHNFTAEDPPEDVDKALDVVLDRDD